MSVHIPGRRHLIPRSRRLTSDLLFFNRTVPLCGHDRRMDLSGVAADRSAVTERISWVALFLRAYGLVAAQFPELRQTWYRWPWAHLYEHPHSVASVTVHREWRGENWLFWGQIDQPETMGLVDIQRQLDEYRDGAPGTVFRRQVKLAQLPTPLRRLLWWWNLNVAGAGRAERLGTFFLSTLAGRGTEIQIPPAVHTGCLTFGPLDDDGLCRVTVAYDHRLMDGVRVAEILQALEVTLKGQLTSELQSLHAKSAEECAA